MKLLKIRLSSDIVTRANSQRHTRRAIKYPNLKQTTKAQAFEESHNKEDLEATKKMPQKPLKRHKRKASKRGTVKRAAKTRRVSKKTNKQIRI